MSMITYSYFSSSLTSEALGFEVGAGIFIAIIIFFGWRNYRFFLWRFFALALGVFCFEGLTGAMWDISHLGKYAYIHNDVSWMMMFTWTSILFGIRFIYDSFCKKKTLLKEYLSLLIGGSLLIGIVLIILRNIGIFSYSITMQEILSKSILILGKPLEAILYIPVFVFTVYSFYKYWELAMYDKNLFLNYKISPTKDIVISVVVISLIGYLMHPLLNTGFVGATLLIVGYIFGLILTSFFIGNIKDAPLFERYIGGMFLFSLFGMALTSIMMESGMVSLAESVKNTHTINTIQIPGFAFSDVELVGIVLFSCLMIAIVKYFKIITDNKHIHLDDKKMTFQGFTSLFGRTPH